MQEAGLTPKYDGHCRDMTDTEVQEKLDAGIPYTIRLRVPKWEIITIQDEIRGRIDTPSADIDDQVLMKQDGFPTYHLASVVDDHLMWVTVAMLGEEWIASGAKKKMIYDAFEFPMPKLAYLPTILWGDRKKLSKRNGDANVTDFLAKGYLVEAIINYVVVVGWNSKSTEEFFSLQELEKIFSLKGVAKASWVFDNEKLDWYNSQYITKTNTEDLYETMGEYLKEHDADFYTSTWAQADSDYQMAILDELKGRLTTLADYKKLTPFFYTEPTIDASLCLHEKMKVTTLEQVKEYLEFSIEIITTLSESCSRDDIKDAYIAKIKEAGYKNGQILWPTRVALTGASFSPWAIEMIDVLWVEKSRKRLERFIACL